MDAAAPRLDAAPLVDAAGPAPDAPIDRAVDRPPLIDAPVDRAVDRPPDLPPDIVVRPDLAPDVTPPGADAAPDDAT